MGQLERQPTLGNLQISIVTNFNSSAPNSSAANSSAANSSAANSSAANSSAFTNSSGYYLYTDANGWVLTTQLVPDLAQDPGPGVVLASSYGDSALGQGRPLDYCNGWRIGNSSRAGLNDITVERVQLAIDAVTGTLVIATLLSRWVGNS